MKRFILYLGSTCTLSDELLFLSRPPWWRASRSMIFLLKRCPDYCYIWGGENHVGIDCSGLVREGLIQANLQQGITTLNPTLIRQGLAMWWCDLSAIALRDGERGWTTKLFPANSINSIDTTKLLPGDLAATADGVHILAYIGNNNWIEADPGERKVIVVPVPAKVNYWFGVRVYTLRWQQLAN